jgi:hypothetical protein
MNETPKKPKVARGGAKPGAGRPKGATSKLSAKSLLDQIQSTCGKPFEELLAEGYHMTILAADMPARQNYEKMILNKVVADKHEIDHTTLGKAMTNTFTFPTKELPDWQDKMPVKITTNK